MAKLLYTAITSFDGYISDAAGEYGSWGEPSHEEFVFLNERGASVGVHLLGRRMYDEMIVWDSAHEWPEASAAELEFARQWRDTDKIVVSTTLADVSTLRTTLVRDLDLDEVRRVRAESPRDIAIAGPSLAASAIRAHLVDEYEFYLKPVALGGGTRALPEGVRLDLELLEERRFASGTIYTRFRDPAAAT